MYIYIYIFIYIYLYIYIYIYLYNILYIIPGLFIFLVSVKTYINHYYIIYK